MSWSAVGFGKYKGKTLPEIIVRDRDWFAWVRPKLYGKLAEEAKEIYRKARAIKIPKGKGKKTLVEYRCDIDNRFCGFELVEASSWQFPYSHRLPHLDLTWRLGEKKCNKRGGRIMIQDFRLHYFGKYKR
jgi:hypothetical protein